MFLCDTVSRTYGWDEIETDRPKLRYAVFYLFFWLASVEDIYLLLYTCTLHTC